MSQKNRENNTHNYFIKAFYRQKSIDGSYVKLNIHYFNDKYQKEEIYSRHYNCDSTQSILTKIKQKFDKIDRMEAAILRVSNKNVEIVDDEDLLASILRFQLNTPEYQCQNGLDILIKSNCFVETTNIQNNNSETVNKPDLMFGEDDLKELESIRSTISNKLNQIQKNPIMIVYLNIIHEESKVTRGMIYSFQDSYLFMEGLEYKLGDWYKRGDSVRYLCPKTNSYTLIEDEFNFYAAIQSIVPERFSSQTSMELFINGAELE